MTLGQRSNRELGQFRMAAFRRLFMRLFLRCNVHAQAGAAAPHATNSEAGAPFDITATGFP